MADQKAAWKCPKCNAENDPDFTHCRLCGAHNPAGTAEKKCASCGFLASKESCCPVCGSEQFLQL
jgi:RNA polymerase subunit RPABC4/transcription elongation factor Spt4